MTGRIVVLNGPPRSGKSSIAAAIQDRFDGVWMNLGVDHVMRMTPPALRPGIGLRPGGERPDLEPLVVRLYHGLYEAVAAHSRLGVDVVVDAVHHDSYSAPRGILRTCARLLDGLPVLFVGVRCPVEVAMERRRATWGGIGYTRSGAVEDPVGLWHAAVHDPGIYDLEVDTSVLRPDECADLIASRLTDGPPPSAFERLAGEPATRRTATRRTATRRTATRRTAHVWSGVTVDCVDPERVARFFSVLLGRPAGPSEDGWVYLGERGDAQPRLVFQPVEAPQAGKVRIHLDIAVDDIDEAVREVVELGGGSTGERHDHDEGVVVVMTDPEAHEFCLVQYYAPGR